MRQFFGVAALVVVGIAAWRVTDGMSSDAISMAVGVLFGIMAGLPAALLVMAAGRRRERDDSSGDDRRRQQAQQHPAYYGAGYAPGYGPGYAAQPPVIVLAQPGMQPGQGYGYPYSAPARHALPAPEAVDVRQFKVVGEKEEWVDEW